MNLAEALNAALPELPAKKQRIGFPKLDPTIIVREDFDDGKPVVLALTPAAGLFYRFPPAQWQLIELFDGEKSYAEVAEEYSQISGMPYSEQEIREFSQQLEEADFWYKTPQEKNIALTEKLKAERSKHHKKKSKFGDVSHVEFSAWDPDKFMDAVYARIHWVYTGWFTTLTLCVFAFMTYIIISRWGEIGRDTLEYYTFTHKGASDLLEFWLLFFGLAFIHESAHGLTCKHYGGAVHRMGFHLIYLSPAFFVDVSEAWVYARRWQRLATIMAGIWVEMMFCSIGAIIWWGTPPGTYVHELAYKIVLITGVAVLVVNMNPLIKLDGYYAFSEILGFANIKELSTAYLSSIVRKYLFWLPADVEYLTWKRRILYVCYAILSGIYSYGLLYAVVRFTYNVFRNYSPDWAFVPAGALAYMIFRSRIRTLVNFMNTVYLDKKERVLRWLKGPRLAVVAAVALVVLFTPIFRRNVEGRFIAEPVNRTVVRAEVGGNVQEVYFEEGDKVTAGAALAKLRSMDVETLSARSDADLRLANAGRANAMLRYADLASADQRRQQVMSERKSASEQASKLEPRSPISGVILSPRVKDLEGRHVEPGAVIAEVGDTSVMRVRIFVPEFDVEHVRESEPVSLHFESIAMPIRGQIAHVNPIATEMAPGLIHEQSYKGIEKPEYYVAETFIPNDGRLRDGMSGAAKITVGRRSLASAIWNTLHDFAGRKLW